jgi:hypothetical protein
MPQAPVDTSNVQVRVRASVPEPAVGAGAQMRRTLQHRRMLLAGLLIAALFSLVLALATEQGRIWAIHALVDTVLVGYLAVLIRLRNAAAEHEMTRRELGR